MKSIIVPVNFSACADNAAHYAAELAQAIGADLYLIHVIQVPVTTADLLMTEDAFREIADGAGLSLDHLRAQLIKHTHGRINVETMLDAGSIGDKLLALCGKLDTYGIVLGASGSSLEKFLAGSPLRSLLGIIPFPVLVVPETTTFQKFRRVALACDLNDITSGIPQALPLLKDLRDYFGTRFDVVTVQTKKLLDLEQRMLQSDAWKVRFKDLYPETHFIRDSNVEGGLLQYLGKNEADMVIVFPKSHGFFDFHVSQSRKLASHSSIPVMSVHE